VSADTLLVALLVLLALALLLRRRTARRRADLGLPEGPVVYQDAGEGPVKTLYSARYHLVGRPDQIVQEAGYYIPVEVKSGRTPRQPYPGQVMQLIAYCALVEENYGVRPPYGLIYFEASGTWFEIEYSPDQEAAFADTLAAMRRARAAPEVHRSHQSPPVCAACGYNALCDERLAG